MDFKQAKIDGVDILQEGIIYTQTNRRKLAVNEESKNIDGTHGRITSPIYARYRIITLEGVIDRLILGEQDKIKHLQDIFSLQNNLGKLEEKELYIKDNFDDEWKLNVIIKEPLDIIEGDENLLGSYWKWRVVLESTSSPIYKSYNELFVNGIEGNIGGFNMGFNLGIPFDVIDEIIELNTSKTETYTRFEMDVIGEVNKPLTIKNITNDTFFALNTNAIVGDKIIVDSQNFTATKNGENIIGDRIAGSIWQKISGNNKFVITDIDGNIVNKDLNLKIYYRNALL